MAERIRILKAPNKSSTRGNVPRPRLSPIRSPRVSLNTSQTARSLFQAAKPTQNSVLQALAGRVKAPARQLFAPLGDVAKPTAGSTLHRFRDSLRHMESGGRYNAIGIPTKYGRATGAYQYLDSTWNGYKGYRRAADAPAAIQDERATADMQRLYDRYGDWRLVALAWHGGPGLADRARRGSIGGRGDGLISSENYARNILRRAGLV